MKVSKLLPFLLHLSPLQGSVAVIRLTRGDALRFATRLPLAFIFSRLWRSEPEFCDTLTEWRPYISVLAEGPAAPPLVVPGSLSAVTVGITLRGSNDTEDMKY